MTARQAMPTEQEEHAQSQCLNEDAVRERQVIHALRSEDAAQTLDPRDAPDPISHSWFFAETTCSQHEISDVRANGSLVLHAYTRIRDYEIEIAHLMTEYGILDDKMAQTSVQRLWREEALCIFASVVRVVAKMHAEDVCHLDLNPESIVIDADSRAMIRDWRCAEVMSRAGVAGRGRAILGKLEYASPEVATHNRYSKRSPGIDGRSADVYSLGVLLYWLLTLLSRTNEFGRRSTCDPVRHDPTWNRRLVRHLRDPSTCHDQCTVCLMGLPQDDELAQILASSLSLGPHERLSAVDMREMTRHYQLRGGLFERCIRAFEDIRAFT